MPMIPLPMITSWRRDSKTGRTLVDQLLPPFTRDLTHMQKMPARKTQMNEMAIQNVKNFLEKM